MSLRIVGPNPLLVSMLIERDPAKGFTTTYVYEGDQLQIYGLARQVRSDQRYAIDDTDKPKFRLTLQSPDAPAADQTDDYVWTVELLGNDVEHSVYDHPRARALGNAILTVVKVAVKDVADAEIADVPTSVLTLEFIIRTKATEAGVDPDDAISLFRLLVRESTSYVESQYVLRRTQTVGSKTLLNVSFDNINCIYSKTALEASEFIPFAVRFSILSIPEPTAQTGYVWGWLKKSPTINQVAQGRFTSTQEYWLGQWSTFLYPIVP